MDLLHLPLAWLAGVFECTVAGMRLIRRGFQPRLNMARMMFYVFLPPAQPAACRIIKGFGIENRVGLLTTLTYSSVCGALRALEGRVSVPTGFLRIELCLIKSRE